MTGLNSITVMVVEKDPGKEQEFRDCLKGAGYEMVFHTDGQEALKAIEKRPPDVVVADIFSSSLNGIQLCHRLKQAEEYANIPFILMTSGFDTLNNQVQGLKTKPDEYIRSPMNPDELLFRIKNALLKFVETKRILKFSYRTDPAFYHLPMKEKSQSSGSTEEDSILIVDPTKFILKMVESEFQDAGCRFDIALNGKQAIELVKARQYQLILSDGEMEEMDGYELCHYIRNLKNYEIVPFIFVCRETGQNVRLRGLRLGADDYITYPFESAELMQKVTNAMDKSRRIREHTLIDKLTNVYNRGYFDLLIRKEFRRHTRGKQTLSLVMTDIDFFKKVNDTYGHQAGDVVLRMVAGLLKDQLRDTDVVARYGGEEFVLVLPETSEPAAVKLAKNLRKKIESEVFPVEQKNLELSVTMSFGVSSSKGVESSADLISNADSALYQAKKDGRNRVCRYKSSKKGGAVKKAGT